MLEYLLAGSTVAKGFASYSTTLVGTSIRSSDKTLPISSQTHIDTPCTVRHYLKDTTARP
jgi:hypothetical protein